MNNLDKLIRLARVERPCDVDVADEVLWRISQGAVASRRSVAALSVFAGVSAVAASILLMFAIQAWQAMQDPFFELVRPIQVAAPW